MHFNLLSRNESQKESKSHNACIISVQCHFLRLVFPLFVFWRDIEKKRKRERLPCRDWWSSLGQRKLKGRWHFFFSGGTDLGCLNCKKKMLITGVALSSSFSGPFPLPLPYINISFSIIFLHSPGGGGVRVFAAPPPPWYPLHEHSWQETWHSATIRLSRLQEKGDLFWWRMGWFRDWTQIRRKSIRFYQQPLWGHSRKRWWSIISSLHAKVAAGWD